ncbi:MAG TPA: agmatine deiminase family protein [Pirellulales bacterium]|nr:agmatine deiminase family protein [Pirellulales bacterium]
MITSGRVVGGFEHQAAMILGVNELIQYHPQTLAQIVAAIHDRIKIIGVVANSDQQAKTIALLKDNNLPEDCIDFFQWPVEAMWVRDYAPYFVVGDHATVIDYTYPEQNRDLEDSFSVAFAATFGLHYTHAHLTLEGGNLTSNGDGLCITTTRIGAGNEARGYNAERIGQLLHDYFHFDRWVHLKPLEDEPTGHTDMFLTVCAVNKVIVGLYRSDEDAVNAPILDENSSALKGEPTKNGPMDVIRIPMPSHKDGNWRSYTNVIYANGVVLVPQYPDTDPDLDKVALNVFHEALPDWKMVGIDCSKLIAKRGALHCISRQVPSLGDNK